MKPDWLKFKKYPHIGLPITAKDKDWVINYVNQPKKISTHKFTPLLHKSIKQRKFRPGSSKKNQYKKRIRVVKTPKVREIFYASHLDSIVYSFYSKIINNAYNEYLEGQPFNPSIVAYRKIPIVPGKEGNKSNIEFAKEAFDFIYNNRNSHLSIIVADVTSFFDNLDHRILHRKWKEVVGTTDEKGNITLPDDHYNIYKSLVKLRYVNENELYKRFKEKLFVERGIPNNSIDKIQKRIEVKKRKNLFREGVIAYCTKKEFFENHYDLIHSKKHCCLQKNNCSDSCYKKGIPQGTPISATLANVYMLDFDSRVYNEVMEKEGFYQRYSDDLIIVCQRKDEDFFIKEITSAIEVTAKLEIQTKKTNVYRYSPENGYMAGGRVEEGRFEGNPNYQLEYLGFKFDGKKIYVKTFGFSKFYRSMKRTIKRGTHFSAKSKRSDGLFKNRLYKRFTVKGAKRRLIWRPDRTNPDEYVRTEQQNWGNYFSYIYKANNVMKVLNGDDTIKKQTRRMWKKFHNELNEAKTQIESKRKNEKIS